MFLLIGLLLVLATTAVMIWPLLRRSPAADTGPDDEALARVFKDRRVLIQQELQSGLIEPHEAQRAEEALAQELADRLQTSALESPKETSVEKARASAEARRPWLAASMGLCLPIIGICLYLIKGNPELAIPGANLSGTEQAGLRSLELLAQDKASYQAQVAQWKQDLVAKPDEVNTWLSLALLHKAAGDYGEALQSFGEALRRGADQDARSLAEFAETIALARDKRFEGEPYELLKRAMTIDPNDSKVVSLMAAAHYQVGEKAQARALLEQLLAAMPPESAQAEQLRALIASLPGAASATETTITVSLAISPAMLQGLAPAAVLYVSARAAQGPRMPIAVWRARVSELKFDAQADQGAGPEQSHAQKTLQVKLSNAERLDPARALDGALWVEAHISQSGLAGRQAGDPFAQGASAALGQGKAQASVRLNIDERYKP